MDTPLPEGTTRRSRHPLAVTHPTGSIILYVRAKCAFVFNFGVAKKVPYYSTPFELPKAWECTSGEKMSAGLLQQLYPQLLIDEYEATRDINCTAAAVVAVRVCSSSRCSSSRCAYIAAAGTTADCNRTLTAAYSSNAQQQKECHRYW